MIHTDPGESWLSPGILDKLSVHPRDGRKSHSGKREVRCMISSAQCGPRKVVILLPGIFHGLVQTAVVTVVVTVVVTLRH